MTAESLGARLFDLQQKAEDLWEQGEQDGSEPTELTPEQATVLSELTQSILDLTRDSQLQKPTDSLPIPGTTRSTISRKQSQRGDPAFETELVHSWTPQHPSFPWLAVITDEQSGDDVLTRVRVEIQRPYLPSRVFSYPPIKQI